MPETTHESIAAIPLGVEVADALPWSDLAATLPAPAAETDLNAVQPIPDWIEMATPPGADVLYTNACTLPLTNACWTAMEPRWRFALATSVRVSPLANHPRRHPDEAPRAEQRQTEMRIAEAWMRCHALMHALREATRLTSEHSLAVTASWLARGAVREPGVPIYDRLMVEHWTYWDRRGSPGLRGAPSPFTVGNKLGATIRRIESAATHDLRGVSVANLSRGVGWTEGPGEHEALNHRQAKRHVQGGRAILHMLGAWPWTHADGGRLHEHPRWWEQNAFRIPLQQWLDAGWLRATMQQVFRRTTAERIGSNAPAEATQATSSALRSS